MSMEDARQMLEAVKIRLSKVRNIENRMYSSVPPLLPSSRNPHARAYAEVEPSAKLMSLLACVHTFQPRPTNREVFLYSMKTIFSHACVCVEQVQPRPKNLEAFLYSMHNIFSHACVCVAHVSASPQKPRSVPTQHAKHFLICLRVDRFSLAPKTEQRFYTACWQAPRLSWSVTTRAWRTNPRVSQAVLVATTTEVTVPRSHLRRPLLRFHPRCLRIMV